MRLLEKDSLKGIDSTSKTIEKWDAFLKKAVWNMGYGEDVTEHMYPYEKGIPLISGEYMPVDAKSGRRFFEMSWADKLAGQLSCIANTSGDSRQIYTIRGVILYFASKKEEIFNAMFPGSTDTYEDLVNYLTETSSVRAVSSETGDNIAQRLWERFIDDSDISEYSMHVEENTSTNHGYLSETTKDDLKHLSKTRTLDTGGVFFIFNKNLENEFSKYPKDLFREAFTQVTRVLNTSSGVLDALKMFDEVYCSDYLVVSLNPVDKLMCSTKQAFGSCMSFAKQNDTRGTNSTHAFGIPALFPSDNVFLIFTTPGKHKNMYWETSEWEKDPTERDPEKAYKYLKMSCRALTYKGVLEEPIRDILKGLTHLNADEAPYSSSRDRVEKMIEGVAEVKPETERLYVGRQYSANGEDYRWQGLVEVLLARVGVSTSMAYAGAINKIFKDRTGWLDLVRRCLPGSVYSQYISNTPHNLLTGSGRYWIRKGEMPTVDFVCLDRYGFQRGIYFDNVSIAVSEEYLRAKSKGDFTRYGFKKPKGFKLTYGPAHIHVGSSRSGSCSFSYSATKSGLDAFKLMNGEQDYSYYNCNLKVCHYCGKILTPDDPHDTVDGGYSICTDCCEKKGIHRCEACGKLYTKENAADHEVYNIMELLNPKMADVNPVMLCRSQLMLAAVDGDIGTSICAHCGKILREYVSYDRMSVTYAHREFHGIDIKFRLCNSCIAHAALCDKCKRLVFLDSVADACLLLPNRRIICPDCIDSIRAKKEKKELYKEILSPENIAEAVKPEPASDISVEDEAARIKSIRHNGDLGNVDTRVKDPRKQIVSYLQSHPEEGLPALKPSNPPVVTSAPDDEMIVDEEQAVPF